MKKIVVNVRESWENISQGQYLSNEMLLWESPWRYMQRSTAIKERNTKAT